MHEAQRRHQFDPQRTSVSPYAYLRRGCYIEELLMYERYFPREQMYISLAEECIGQVQSVQQLYAFLGVDASFVPPSLHRRVNARMEGEAAPAGTPTSYATLPAHVQAHLRGVFAAPNARLAEYLQRDLQLWHHE